jgi:2-amino-4-hydroxy-6-hydroxymethyldihydropteridine diphosphokinase
MHVVFISLGSNLGDRQYAFLSAHKLMAEDIILVSASKIYETPPWGYEDQPCFLNQVIKATTLLSPIKLLDKLKWTERKVGRKPNFRYGPRLIDLDILFYDDLIYKTELLTIPHPEITNRAFVLRPLMDIAPNYIHPENQKKISDLINLVEINGLVEFKGQND